MEEEMNCPACHRFKTTSIPEYAYGCLSCEARAIATSEEANVREADKGAALNALMRRTWTEVNRFKRGRSAMWDWIKKLSTKEMTT